LGVGGVLEDGRTIGPKRTMVRRGKGKKQNYRNGEKNEGVSGGGSNLDFGGGSTVCPKERLPGMGCTKWGVKALAKNEKKVAVRF